MSGWANFANFGNSAIQGYDNYERMLAARQQRELQAQAARAYGESLQKMAAPPWRVPMANDYTPPPQPFTMPSFMQAMPKGVDPAALGMAVNQFAPLARNQELDNYRDQQIKLGQERNRQGSRRIDLAEQRIEARDRQNEIANGFRQKQLAIQATGVLQRNPVAAREWDRVETAFTRANVRFDNAQRAIEANNRTGAMGGNPDVFEARANELAAELKSARADLEAAKSAYEGFDMSGQGLPQPGMSPVAPPAPPPGPSGGAPDAAALNYLRDNAANPAAVQKFEQRFGPGSAQRFMQQSPQQQNQMQPQPGPQGGPFVGQPAAVKAALINREEAGAAQANQALQAQRAMEMQQEAGRAAQMTNRPYMPLPAGQPRVAPRDAQPTMPMVNSGGATNLPLGTQDPGPVNAALGDEGAPVDARPDDLKIRDWFAQNAPNYNTEGKSLADLRVARAMLDLGSQADKLAADREGVVKSARDLRNDPVTKGKTRGSTNPYMGFTMEQLNAEMGKLAVREFAARTPEEKAAVKRAFDQMFEASAAIGNRRQRGS